MISEKAAGCKSNEVLTKIEALAKKNFLPIIGPERGKFLADEVRKAKPCHVLEVGTLVGYSSILIGNELDENAEIVTIEIHREEAEVARENVVKANIAPKIKIVTGNALQVIPTLDGSFDFAFIDAEKTEYILYLQLMEDKLSKGAVVFADNAGIFADQMSNYLDYVRKSGKYKSRYIQVGEDGVEISVKL
jgi:predicted O-methyltransferase YrrM